MQPTPEEKSGETIDYQLFKELRDAYREHRQGRIPKPTRSMVVGPDGQRIHHHTGLREPRDLLWIPEEHQAPGVIDQHGRRSGPAMVSARFVLGVSAELQALPVSLCAGIDDDVHTERAARECSAVETLSLPAIPPRSSYWVGLRVNAEIPEELRHHVRAVIISATAQKA